jgi:hypothetical protein
MKSNPITQHLTRNHRWPSLREAGLIALGLCAISMAAFVLGVDVIVQISLYAVWIVTLLTPLVIAVMSPLLVRQTTGDEKFQLLKLTPLSPDDIRQGFTQAALFRVRVLLAAQIGLLPVWVARMFSDWYALSMSYAYYTSNQPPESPNIAAPVIVIALTGIGLFGFNLVAAVFGVGQGLRTVHPARSIAVSLGFVLLIPVLCYIPGLTLWGQRLEFWTGTCQLL